MVYFEELMIVKNKISLDGGSTKIFNISNEQVDTIYKKNDGIGRKNTFLCLILPGRDRCFSERFIASCASLFFVDILILFSV